MGSKVLLSGVDSRNILSSLNLKKLQVFGLLDGKDDVRVVLSLDLCDSGKQEGRRSPKTTEAQLG